MDGGGMILSCDGCLIGPGERCQDCLVSALTGPHPAALDGPTLRAVTALQEGEMLPPFRKVVAG